MLIKLIKISGLIVLSAQLTSCTEQTTSTKKLATDVAIIGIQVKTAPRKLKTDEQFTLPIAILNNGVGLIPSQGKSEFLKVTAT
ncbi:MAG: hypothetical protein NTY70_03395 [Burkholderiales bacterium]|nr:hypothetical protein [Burkholderiales bacterium]